MVTKSPRLNKNPRKKQKALTPRERMLADLKRSGLDAADAKKLKLQPYSIANTVNYFFTSNHLDAFMISDPLNQKLQELESSLSALNPRARALIKMNTITELGPPLPTMSSVAGDLAEDDLGCEEADTCAAFRCSRNSSADFI
jgi:hypothetical protein